MVRVIVSLIVLLGMAAPARAVITILTPLKQVLDVEEQIFTATVHSVDAEKPEVIFTAGKSIKGEVLAKTLKVDLTGDAYAKRNDHLPIMLARFAPKRELVIFTSKTRKGYSAFCYMEGTWFQLRGTPLEEGIDWAFLHGEPYLRRTFRGTTAELQAIIERYYSKKVDPPTPDDKVPPGFGPEADPKQSLHAPRDGLPRSGVSLLAVIPTFVMVGPLALIAALFPGLFARLAMVLTRWRVLCTVASINSTLALIYLVVRGYLPDHPAFSPAWVAIVLTAITWVGVAYAGWRYRRLARVQPEITAPPDRGTVLTLAGVCLVSAMLLGLAGGWIGWGELMELPWREFTLLGVGIAGATVYAAYRRYTGAVDDSTPGSLRLSLSGESVALLCMGIGGLLLVSLSLQSAGRGPTMPLSVEGPGNANPSIRLQDAHILMETAAATQVLTSVASDGEVYYCGGVRRSGFRSSGIVWAIDRQTGQIRWAFDDDHDLKPVFTTPALDQEHVYIGEGLHTDGECRMLALDRQTGQIRWQVTTRSHTEGTPRIENGKVYFPAGEDGVYCLRAADGHVLWHRFAGEHALHIDTPVALAVGRVFFGSGYNTLAVLAADASTGEELWRHPTRLRSFGPPLVAGAQVLFGLGTGNLLDELSREREVGVPRETHPAGAVLCLDAATGRVQWETPLPRPIHTTMAADERHVYACSQDGWVYALARSDGSIQWKRQIGEAFASGVSLAPASEGWPAVLYAVTRSGDAVALQPVDGHVLWARSLAEMTERNVEVFATPRVYATGSGKDQREVVVGVKLTNRNNRSEHAAIIRFVEERIR